MTSLVVLFGELHGKLVQYFFGVTLESSVKGARTVDNDKPEWGLSDEKLLLQVVKVELAFATVNGQVDWLEWLEVANEFFLGS